jgi:hypothetical protein
MLSFQIKDMEFTAFTTEILAGKFVMFGEDKMAPVTSYHQRAFLFTNTRLFYVIATG